MTQQLHKFEVQVERVGRSVKDETWTLEAGPCFPEEKLDRLAEEIYKRARRHLMSSDVDVAIAQTHMEPNEGTFQVFAGFNNGGSGTWREATEAVSGGGSE